MKKVKLPEEKAAEGRRTPRCWRRLPAHPKAARAEAIMDRRTGKMVASAKEVQKRGAIM
jgi:hypothetical protein